MGKFLVIVLLWSLSVYGGQLTVNIDFGNEVLTEFSHQGYSRIQVSNCETIGLPGEPLLPVKVVSLVVPAGAENVTLSSSSSDIDVINSISGVIQPAAVPRPFSAVSSTSQVLQEDPSIYLIDEFWPEDRVRNQRCGNKSGYTVVSFLVYPYRYNPVSRLLEFRKSVDVTLHWDEGFPAEASPGQIRNAGAQLGGWISNPEDIPNCSPSPAGFDAVDYLVITGSDYSDSFAAFVAFKNSQGIVTELIDIDDILLSTSGYDDAEKLRNYIKERYNSDGIQHVLLAGDQTVIPARTVNLSCEGNTDNVPVDLYYSDLDGTWDASCDHNYGQTNDDLDLYADVSVGRALLGTTDEAALFVERTMMYESAPPSGDWQTSAMLCGAGLFTGYTGAKVCDSIAVNLPEGWDITKAYESAKSDDGFTTPIDVINSGTNWVHYAGHGSTTGIFWQGYPSSMMTNSIAQGLTNGNMAGIHHSIACMPGAFQDGECCAEALLHNPAGGAVSVMFNTSYGWEGNVPEMGISEWMCVYLTEEVFQNGNTLIGDAFATSKDRRVPLWSGGYDRELYCILDWHGFHDPTLVPLNVSTGVVESTEGLIEPLTLSLSRPIPNPVVSGSSVYFNTNFAGSPAAFTIFDITGRQVFSRLMDEPGAVQWNTRSSLLDIQPGVYFIRLETLGESAVCKLTIIN